MLPWLQKLLKPIKGSPAIAPRDALGGRGENVAARFLRNQGFKIILRNFQSPGDLTRNSMSIAVWRLSCHSSRRAISLAGETGLSAMTERAGDQRALTFASSLYSVG